MFSPAGNYVSNADLFSSIARTAGSASGGRAARDQYPNSIGKVIDRHSAFDFERNA
jgi:hypothetical protein